MSDLVVPDCVSLFAFLCYSAGQKLNEQAKQAGECQGLAEEHSRMRKKKLMFCPLLITSYLPGRLSGHLQTLHPGQVLQTGAGPAGHLPRKPEKGGDVGVV